MKCLDCKYSHGQPGGLECRGKPPIGDERFPLVRDDQWCGVFEVAELNVAETDQVEWLESVGKAAGRQPVRPPGTPDIPPEELTPPSGESSISGPPDPAGCPQTPPSSGVPDPAIAAEPQSLRRPSHAKTPRRKGKHGQETSSQES